MPRTARPAVAPVSKPSRTGRWSTAHIEDFLTFRLSVIASTIARGTDLIHTRGYGVSVRQWRVLAILARSNGINSQQVSVRSMLDKSQVSRAVSELAWARRAPTCG
jgi:hypothetical protein